VRCGACAAETTLEQFPAHCSACGGFDVKVTGGEELLADSLEIEDDVALTPTGG
jgi:Zn finger protein HypA/HybF involved in hydrogenase expression